MLRSLQVETSQRPQVSPSLLSSRPSPGTCLVKLSLFSGNTGAQDVESTAESVCIRTSCHDSSQFNCTLPFSKPELAIPAGLNRLADKGCADSATFVTGVESELVQKIPECFVCRR